MNSVKQAFNQIKKDWRTNLLFGFASTIFVIVVHNLPYINAFLLSLGALVFQHLAQNLLIDKNGKSVDFSVIKKNFMSFLIVSLILLPSNVLLGSALGILQSPQDVFTTFFISGGLITIGLFFYFLFSHSLIYHLRTKENLGKSIDITGISTIKNFRFYITLSSCFAILIMLSNITKGALLIITLPLLFYTTLFSYLEIRK
ncbi:MAG: hypothetical protein ACXVCY_12940 [Pseudobdellovibrionaceae bacterium]